MTVHICEAVAPTRICREEYSSVLPELKHVFLVGNLLKPTPHPFLPETRVEFVVCEYQPGDDGIFHWHANVTEYELILEGKIAYTAADTRETIWGNVGDLLQIPAGACVYRHVPEHTRTVAVKVPSLPEKVYCQACMRECPSRCAEYEG